MTRQLMVLAQLSLPEGMSTGPLLAVLVVNLVFILSLWRVFTRAGEDGWKALVPVYNLWVLLGIVGRPKLWVLVYVLVLFPIPNFSEYVLLLFMILIFDDLAASFGQSRWFTAGLVLLPVVFLPLLAFGGAQYLGPAGATSRPGYDRVRRRGAAADPTPGPSGPMPDPDEPHPEEERGAPEELSGTASVEHERQRQALADERAHRRSAQALSEAGTPPSPQESILYADQLVAGYLPGVNILNGTNLHVREGELVGIIGPNGAGKSTLIKAMFGLVQIHEGQVVLRGEEITGRTAHELVDQGVGYVPQTKNVFPTLTIEENMQMGVYLRPSQFKERFDFVAGLFPKLADRRKQRAGSLSGGERQMVAMGRALMMDPSVLFLDEPSAGLSPANQGVVFHRVKQINDAGVTIVMVEQNAQQCLRICDRGYVLDQGRDAYTGTGEELLRDPKVIELYLGTLAKAE